MSSDPTKVVRAALQGAASVAGLLITTEAMVAESCRRSRAWRCRAGPGGGMGGMDFSPTENDEGPGAPGPFRKA